MNKAQRAQISDAAAKVREAISVLEGIRDEEQEKFDNLPEGLQASPTGEKLSEGSENLSSGIDTLTSAIDDLDQGIGEIEDVASS